MQFLIFLTFWNAHPLKYERIRIATFIKNFVTVTSYYRKFWWKHRFLAGASVHVFSEILSIIRQHTQ